MFGSYCETVASGRSLGVEGKDSRVSLAEIRAYAESAGRSPGLYIISVAGSTVTVRMPGAIDLTYIYSFPLGADLSEFGVDSLAEGIDLPFMAEVGESIALDAWIAENGREVFA